MSYFPSKSSVEGEATNSLVMENGVALVWLVILLVPFLAYAAPAFSQYFAYQRDLVMAGEIWRLFSASFIPFNSIHAALNSFALAMLILLFGVARDVRAIVVFVVLGLAVYCAEYLFSGHVWARGMSGAVYGFGVFGALTYLTRLGGFLALTLVTGKTVFDYLGLSPDMEITIGSPVLHSHHAFGAVAALVLVLAMVVRRRLQRN
jgi:hypothetical protein